MISASLAALAGFLMLAWGADRFVLGAAGCARNLGVSTLIIGLTIAGFGTSAPEVLVSGMAAWEGNSGLAVGNAVGSNIANIGLILGVTALIAPLTVHSGTLRREFPMLLTVTALAFVLIADGDLSVVDGGILLAGQAAMLFWLVRLGLKQRRDPLEEEFAAEIPSHMPMARALLWLVAGFAVLIVGARVLVWGAVTIAHGLGVSDLVIGLSIVALGTSLPELAVSVMSAIKQEHDIAIGNVIGSNMFNLLTVLGLPGLIHPTTLGGEVLYRDFPTMIVLSLVLFAMVYRRHGHGRITRFEGAILLAAYAAYLGLLVAASL